MATAEDPETTATADTHDHPEWLAHHFETPEQQFNAGKLGMWLFLAQEVLFFSGLFVAYTVYRANHPEVFINAHEFLNPWLGALNTIVLLASSLAIAWGVRAVQKNQQSTLLWMHIFTLACAGFFLGVKVVEYGYKFDEGLFWAGYDRDHGHWAQNLVKTPDGHVEPKQHLGDTGFHTHLKSAMLWSGVTGLALFLGGWWMFRSNESNLLGRVLTMLGLALACWWLGVLIMSQFEASSDFARLIGYLFVTCLLIATLWLVVKMVGLSEKVWGAVCVGLGLTLLGAAGGVVVGNGVQLSGIDGHTAAALGSHDGHTEGEEHAAPGEATGESTGEATTGPRPANEGNFFSIYFAMTGVHALHILAGIAAISWIIARTARGDFGPERYGPVEYVGLYWHLVDLVWIYLFPLLYLIR